MKPQIVRERIIQTIRAWLTQAGKDPAQLRVLENPDLDLAVARGAAYYAAVRQGGAGLRMRSGLARSLYVGLGGSPEKASADWLCVVPRDAAEGQPVEIPGPPLQLLAGRKVAFPLATSSIRPQDKTGDLLEFETKGIRSLPPLEAEIKVGRKAKAETVPVRLEAQVNAIGTVDLWCVSLADPRRWQLEVGVRNIRRPESDEEAATVEKNVDAPESAGVIDTNRLDQAKALIQAAFAHPKAEDEAGPSRLVKKLEEVLDADRATWPATACRSLFDTVRGLADARKKSPGHETRWLNLLGYLLRPGTGQPGDDQRLKSTWALFGAGPVNGKETQVWVEWWVLWRRLAPGLNRAQQEEVWRRLQAVLIGVGKKPDRKLTPQEFAEMVRTGASLERLEPATKLQLGTALTLKLQTDASQAPTWLWALGRLGSRQPLYGPVSGVIPAVSVEPWVKTVLSFKPENARARDAQKLALLMMARKEQDRSLDLSEKQRQAVCEYFRGLDLDENEIAPLTEYQPLGRDLSEKAMGESLPLGLMRTVEA